MTKITMNHVRAILNLKHSVNIRDTRNKCLRERTTALRGTHNPAVLNVLSRFLRSVRLVLHLAQRRMKCISSFTNSINMPQRKDFYA